MSEILDADEASGAPAQRQLWRESILRPRPRHLVIAGALAVILAAGIPGYLYLNPFRAPQAGSPVALSQARQQAAAVPVVVGQAKLEDVPVYVYSIGTVQAYNTVNVKARVDGHITEILFKEGQDVKAGDKLAIIDPVPYQAQLKQQIGARDSAAAQLRGAEVDLRRYESLMKNDSIARQQVEDQQALVEQYRAQVSNLDGQIAYARAQLDYTTITSPIDGRVGVRQVDKGNFVQASNPTTIVVITQLQPISAIFTVSSGTAARASLKPGASDVPVLAFAQDQTTQLDRGSVETVDNQVDPATGMIKLKARFANEGLKLWPGDFVNGRVVVNVRHDGLTVPAAAVRHGPFRDFVWVVKEGKAETAPVTVVQTFGNQALLDSGPPPGTRVVVEGHYRLENGAAVTIIQPERQGAAPPGNAPRAP
ncbi:MAG: efflux RND transporter periplasmic adaptor subunit [Alphaproteobacteria bacterium]|nr:efflux RND transporter periplasmic adaptor subunit [Alphaproteobacteria bacterium]